MMPPRHLAVMAFLVTIAINMPISLHGLPITSTPLEDNPDHLTWDALLTLNSYQPEAHEARKIPKSIFITPNFNDSAAACKPGYKLNPRDNKCYKENIQVNQQQLLASQALQAFSVQSDSYTDSIEYDYDEEVRPYEIPLSVSFAGDGTTTKMAEQKPFLGDGGRFGATANNLARRTTDSLPTTPPIVESTTATVLAATKEPLEEPAYVVAQPGFQPAYNIDPVEEATQPMDPIPKATEATIKHDEIIPLQMVVKQVPEETVTQRIVELKFSVPRIEPVPTTTELPSTVTETTIIPTTESVLFNTIPTTTNEEPETEDHESDQLNAHNKIALAQLATNDQNEESSNIVADIDEDLKNELQEESLFPDERPMEVTTLVDDVSTTTDPNDVNNTTDIPETTTVKPELESDDIQVVTDRLVEQPPISVSTAQPIIVLPAKDRIHIITAETPETSTPIGDSIIAATEQLHRETGVETEATKRQRETMMNHEIKADALDTIDQRNRFVYAHLETSPTEATTSTTPTPSVSPSRPSLREQLSIFRQYVDESRKRGKLNEPSNLFFNYRNGAPPPSASRIQFDNPPLSTGHQRLGERTTGNRSQPTPLFAWLPANFKFERSGGIGGRPTINTAGARPALKFWNTMPLIRDPALPSAAAGISTDRAARANSRSPTEQLFRQEESVAPAPPSPSPPHDEVYKVVSTKNAQFQNR